MAALIEHTGLRLTGLSGQGSIPWVISGLVAAFLVELFRNRLSLLDRTINRKERLMRQTLKSAGLCLVETFFAIGASVAVGPLLA